MAKRDINRRTGKYAPSHTKQIRDHFKYLCADIDREEKLRNPLPVINGNRFIILEVYRKTNSKEEAYKTMDEINKKFGREVYTRENVDSWINEEFGNINSKNEKGIDDDDAR